MPFNQKTTTQQWITFLQILANTNSTFEQPVLICSNPIMYKNGIARQLWVQKATMEATAIADGTM